MMFDTKTTSPLPTNTSESNPNCYLQVNEYIPCDQTPEAVAVTPVNKDKLGRELFYEPHLFFSPVLASERIVEDRESTNYNDNKSNKNSTTPDKKRLMTAVGVDALTQQLFALYLGGSSWKKEAAATPTPASPKSVSFETEEGRFDQSFYSPKTHCHVMVKRSYRIASLAIE